METGIPCGAFKPTNGIVVKKKKVDGSWFSTTHLYPRKPNSSPISYPSSMCSPAVCTGSVSTVNASRKIKLYPTTQQKSILRQISGISRYTYNKTVEILREGTVKASWKSIKTDIIHNLPDWADNAPYQVRAIAIKDACDAVSRAKQQYRKTGQIQNVKFRSKKAPAQSFYLPKSAVSRTGIFTRILGKTIKSAEPIPDVEHDGRVLFEYGSWWLCLPVEITTEIPITKDSVVSLDPGVRTFMTYYSENSAGFIAQGDWRTLIGYCYELDKLMTKMSKSKSARKQNQKRAATRIRRRITFLRDELHWKTAVWLTKNYHTIVIPALPAGELSRKHQRKLRAKSVRAMLTYSHSAFLSKLRHACAKYGSKLMIVSEAYTSKTCTRCGHIHEKLAGNETYKCPSCGLVISRDINGARNILLRAMVDQPTDKNLSA